MSKRILYFCTAGRIPKLKKKKLKLIWRVKVIWSNNRLLPPIIEPSNRFKNYRYRVIPCLKIKYK